MPHAQGGGRLQPARAAWHPPRARPRGPGTACPVPGSPVPRTAGLRRGPARWLHTAAAGACPRSLPALCGAASWATGQKAGSEQRPQVSESFPHVAPPAGGGLLLPSGAEFDFWKWRVLLCGPETLPWTETLQVSSDVLTLAGTLRSMWAGEAPPGTAGHVMQD